MCNIYNKYLLSWKLFRFLRATFCCSNQSELRHEATNFSWEVSHNYPLHSCGFACVFQQLQYPKLLYSLISMDFYLWKVLFKPLLPYVFSNKHINTWKGLVCLWSIQIFLQILLEQYRRYYNQSFDVMCDGRWFFTN